MTCLNCALEQLNDRATTTERIIATWINVMGYSPIAAEVEKAKKKMLTEFSAVQKRIEAWKCSHEQE